MAVARGIKTRGLHYPDYFVRVAPAWFSTISDGDMTFSLTATLALAIFLVAALYSTVGHAGASGYLACMALAGLPAAVMKPTALALNVVVATIATWKYVRAGYFKWRTLWPFVLTSVPFSFLGGAVVLPGTLYRRAVGVVLVYAAVRLLLSAARADERPIVEPPIPSALATGAVMGFVSGLTGVGGGIFLSPLLLFAGWSETRAASGVAAVFILLNSLSALSGELLAGVRFPVEALWWAPAAAIGGWIGSHYGSRKLPSPAIRRFLAAVVFIAALKMLFA
jgi:uncharacterized membrane protein YfcA